MSKPATKVWALKSLYGLYVVPDSEYTRKEVLLWAAEQGYNMVVWKVIRATVKDA
jgi:hypothetical protein